MKELLQELNGVIGVQGSFLCGTDGQVLASEMPSTFAPDQLETVGRVFQRTLEGLRTTRRRRVDELDLLFERGRLVIRGLPEACLVILCEPNINVPLLALTAKHVTRELQAQLRPAAAPRPGVERAASGVPGRTAPTGEVRQEEAQRLVAHARERKVVLRVAGDAAIRLRCPTAGQLPSPGEDYVLMLAGRARQGAAIGQVMTELGYVANRPFNTLHGDQRLRFAHPETRLNVEVFLDTFVLYHRLEFGDRLHLDAETLSVTDLLLFYLQMVSAGEGDTQYVLVLLADHELGGRDDPERIASAHVVSLCSEDWGWYKTVTMNLGRSVGAAASFLTGEALDKGLGDLQRLTQMIEEAPKTLRWQVRARIGESVRWYDEPE